MKFPPFRRLASLPERFRYPLALGAGMCLGLSFPLPGWGGLAWIAPGLLFVAGMGLRPMEAFRVGYISGLACFLFSLRWLLAIPHPAGSIGAWLALSAYCASYPGLWLAWVRCEYGASPNETAASTASLPIQRPWVKPMAEWAGKSWWTRSRWMLCASGGWVVLEMVRGWLLGGFPWNLLGSSQFLSVPLIQCSAWTGIYGVSFLVCWASLGLASSALQVSFNRETRWGWTGEVRLPLIIFLILAGLGIRRVMTAPSENSVIRLALVQPSIPQTLIWDRGADSDRFQRVLELSIEVLQQPVDAIIWPEGSLPDISREQFQSMIGLIRRAGVEWAFGADDIEQSDGESRYFNSAFLVDSGGAKLEAYRKRKLVIFGEFIPFEKFLPFMKWLTPVGGSFTPGKRMVRFPMAKGTATASPVICFEDVFPSVAREHAALGVDFLLEFTNDGWFGEGAGQWQHLAAALFRAVENGTPVVRCTNNGITCWVDANGRIREILGGDTGTYYASGSRVVRVPLGAVEHPTFYRRYGDVFGCFCWVMAGLFTLKKMQKRWPIAANRPTANDALVVH